LIKNDLEERGYSALSLLSEPDVKVLRTLFFEWLGSLNTGVTANPTTWNEARWPKSGKGIWHSYGCGHSAASWALRCHPDVRALFSAVHSCNPADLISGFDGLGFIRPPELLRQIGVEPEEYGSWPHLDFMPQQRGVVRERYDVIQGNIALYNAGPEDGGLVVYAGSHKLFDPMWEGRAVRQFSESFRDGAALPAGAERLKLCGPPGTFFL
jgi:hypothetical protein